MFEIVSEDGKARTGVLKTAHGKVITPFFMPVATKGAAKFVDNKKLEELGTQAIISNAFLLHLKPGLKIIKKFKGIHGFMHFNKTIFTDSGGFQMYSEAFLEKTTKDGIVFKNPFTGEKIHCTPELNMQIHDELKSDVAMVLDDMPLYGSSKERIRESVKKTIAWAERCKKYHDQNSSDKQLLFGIIQGGTHADLRKVCAKKIALLDFDGIAFGGLALGEPAELMFNAVRAGMKELPEQKPKYLMGVGNPEQMLEAIANGIDCFDSRFPTQTGRNNSLFSCKGRINIENAKYRHDERPVDEHCDCPACKHYTRAYLHHLARMNEPTGRILNTIHNIRFIHKLMEDARTAIQEGSFEKFRREFLKTYKGKN